MSRLSPYLFFLIAMLGLGMIALSSDDQWQTEDVNVFEAALIIGGVFLAAHALRWLVRLAADRRETRKP